MLHCPNRQDPDWKSLVARVGEAQAYTLYTLNGGIPAPSSGGEARLQAKLTSFLDKIGFNVETYPVLNDREGKPIPALASVDLMAQVVALTEGRAGLAELSEEAGHVITELMRQTRAPLYASMLRDIESFDLYRQVVAEYGGRPGYDERLLKEEAVGQLIGKILVADAQGETVEEARIDRARTWWGRVMDWLRKLVGNHRPYLADYFEAASALYLDAVPLLARRDAVLYSLGTGGRAEHPAEAKLRQTRREVSMRTVPDANNRQQVIYEREGKVVKRRVEDRSGTDQKTRPDLARLVEDAAPQAGVVKALLGQLQAQREAGISPGKATLDYTGLGVTAKEARAFEAFARDVFQKHPDAQWLTGQVIYDAGRDEAGHVDVLGVEPDGTAHVYQLAPLGTYKKADNSEPVSVARRQAWAAQMGAVRRILESEYGLKVVTAQTMPVEVTYGRGAGGSEVTSVAIGPLAGDAIRRRLKPVFLPTVTTDDEGLDKLMQKLQRLAGDLSAREAKTDAEKTEQKAQLDLLDQAMGDLRLGLSLDSFIKAFNNQAAAVEASGLEDLGDYDLQGAYRYFSAMGELLSEGYFSGLLDRQDTATSEAWEKNLETILGEAQRWARDLKLEIDRRAAEEIERQGIEHLGVTVAQGFFGKWARSLSQSSNKYLQTFYRLVRRATFDVQQRLGSDYERLDGVLESLQKWGQARGLTGEDVYKPLLKVGKDGKWTGNLIGRVSSQFYAERDRAQGDKPAAEVLAWYRKNTTLKKTKAEFNAERVAREEDLRKRYLNAGDKASYTAFLKDFDEKNDFWSDKFALSAYRTDRGWTPTAAWDSEAYKELLRPENAPLREFYDLMQEWYDEAREDLGLSKREIPATFIPNVQAGLFRGEKGSLKDIGQSLLSDIRKDELDFHVDEDGKRTYRVPMRYVRPLEAAQKSKDLGHSLLQFRKAHLTKKHLSEIEDRSKLLLTAYRKGRFTVTDGSGRAVLNALGEPASQAIADSEDFDTMERLMNRLLYGVNLDSKDKEIEVLGETVSMNKAALTTMRYMSKTGLFLNTISSWAGFFGGGMNLLFEASGGQFFSAGQAARGAGRLVKGDKKAWALTEFFDAGTASHLLKKERSLSANWEKKVFTSDLAFVTQKLADHGIQHTALQAYLEGMTIRDGKIVRKEKGEKSLYDLAELKEEKGKVKIDVPGLSDEGLLKVRAQVQDIIAGALGITTDINVSLYGQTLVGRMLGHFRSWIPRMLDERFRGLSYNQDRESWEVGRFRQVFGMMLTKHVGDHGRLAYKLLLDNHLAEKDERYLTTLLSIYKARNPNAKAMTEADLKKLLQRNLRKTLTELVTFAAFFAAAAALAPDDDEDPKELPWYRNYLHKTMDRTALELSFFLSPASFFEIIQNPIPASSTLLSALKVVTQGGGQAWSWMAGDEEGMKENKPGYHFTNLVIGWKTYNGLMKTLGVENDGESTE